MKQRLPIEQVIALTARLHSLSLDVGVVIEEAKYQIDIRNPEPAPEIESALADILATARKAIFTAAQATLEACEVDEVVDDR